MQVSIMAANNSTARIATLGVSVSADGSIDEIREGLFTVAQAEEIAKSLILLANRVRNAARSGMIVST
jgi:hypothetical protein